MKGFFFFGLLVVGGGVGLWRLWIAFSQKEICINGEPPDLCDRIRAAQAIPNDTIYWNDNDAA